jgi:hypothetical protein
MIISVSRRCDIPRFQFNWFLERLNEGFADVTNPFNAAQVRRLSLLPADVDFFVFWTRDPRNILAHAEELEDKGFRFYLMVTVTGYPAALEPNMPLAEIVCAAMGELAEKIDRRRLIWRYDPVLVSSITDANFHYRNFGELAQRLAGTVHRVIISQYDEYGGAKRRLSLLEKNNILTMPPDTKAENILAGIAETARLNGMEIQSCAEAENFAALGIKAGACIDSRLAEELWGITAAGRDKHQRPHCLCAQSVDIGRYGDCMAGCIYCYAQR